MIKKICFLLVISMLLAGCGGKSKLPAPEADSNSQFGVDKNINMKTIDEYVLRDDVAYRDVRMLFDPADYGAIGGEADLTRTIEGFQVVPYPFIGTLASLPVANAYEGETLFDVVWNEDGTIGSAEANYKESMLILEDLFPKDQPIFLMCGGGGYAGMMKSLLLYLGWDEALLYNIGANWEYDGEYALELMIYPEDPEDPTINATWRADYAYIDFERLHSVE